MDTKNVLSNLNGDEEHHRYVKALGLTQIYSNAKITHIFSLWKYMYAGNDKTI